ncbi:hypothetical protein EYF80_020306 [Liparis tanakae]|uniref:Uncharacterized protein n=1 Tax=Liparis tanakae TaxID=230148 RepID=A0A4Z2HX34_9TELE|nr:hypothetical protein EYF80_020306 [Liparis tanakae]
MQRKTSVFTVSSNSVRSIWRRTQSSGVGINGGEDDTGGEKEREREGSDTTPTDDRGEADERRSIGPRLSALPGCLLERSPASDTRSSSSSGNLQGAKLAEDGTTFHYSSQQIDQLQPDEAD